MRAPTLPMMRVFGFMVLALAACGDSDGGADGGATTTGASSTGISSDGNEGSSTAAAADSTVGSETQGGDSGGRTSDDGIDDTSGDGTDDTSDDGTDDTSDDGTDLPAVCGDGTVEGLEVCDGEEGCLDDCTYPPHTVFWEFIEQGVEAGDDARVWGVDFDSNDRPVYGGRRFGTAGSPFATARDVSGAENWTALFVPPSGVAFAFGLEVTADDRVVLPGQLGTLGPPDHNNALATTFVADGTPDWDWQLSSPANGLRVAAAALSDGSIALAGLDNQQPDGQEDLAELTRLTAEGNELWTVNHFGTPGADNEFVDVVALEDDTLVVLGCCSDDGDNILAAYDPEGVPQWQVEVEGVGNLSFFGAGIDVDAEGDIAVAMPTATGSLWVGAYDPDGNLVWGDDVPNTDGVSPNAIAATPQGGYVVAGSQYDGSEGHFWYGLVDGNSTLVWSETVDNPGTGTSARANDVEVDSHGLVLVGGEFTTSAGFPQEIRGFVRYFAP